MSEETPKRKRKACPCRIYRVDAFSDEGNMQECLIPIGQQYATVASAMAGLKEHVRADVSAGVEPDDYVIARIQAQLKATVKQKREVILTEA